MINNKKFVIIFYCFLVASCQPEQDGISDSDMVWVASSELAQISESMGWDADKYPQYSWVGAFHSDENSFDYEIGQGFDLPISASFKGIERRMLLVKKIEWGVDGFKEQGLLPVASAKIINDNLVVESSLLASGFEDLISQDRVNVEGTYILLDHPDSWVGIRGNVAAQKIDGSSVPISGSYISAISSPFKTWSYDQGGFVFAAPSSEIVSILSYHPYLPEYSDISGVSEIAFLSSDIIHLNLEDEWLQRSISLGKSKEWFEDQKSNWFGSEEVINGDWRILSLNLIHYQKETGTSLSPSSGEAQESDFAAGISDISRGTGSAIDLDCDGLDLLGNSSYHSFLSEKGWSVQGDFRVVRDESSIFTSDLIQIDSNQGYCLITTSNNEYRGKNIGVLDPLGGQVSTFSQKIKIPQDTKSLKIRMAWITQEKPWSGAGGDKFFIKWDEQPSVLYSGTMRDLVDGTCLENSCGDWATYTGSFDFFPDSSDKNSDPILYHPSRVLCSNIDSSLFEKEMNLRFMIADIGDRWGDSGLAIDSIVFSDAVCTSSFQDFY